MEVSEEFRRRQVEEERKRKRTTPRTPKLMRKLTQKELLAEAKVTEIKNLASLEAFTRLRSATAGTYMFAMIPVISCQPNYKL